MPLVFTTINGFADEPKLAISTQYNQETDVINIELVSFKQIKIDKQPSALGLYPTTAKNNGIQGDVLLDVCIDRNGTPIKANALWGHQELCKAAVAYVLKWHFKPFVKNSVAIPVHFKMVMPFELRSGRPYERLPKELQP